MTVETEIEDVSPDLSRRAATSNHGQITVHFRSLSGSPPTVLVIAAVFKEHKIDVVISTIGKVGVSAQKPLVDAAKLAAVKLFSANVTAAGIGEKYQIAEYLKSLNIPSVRIFNGVLVEFIPWLTGYAEHGKIRIVEEPVSFTSISDVAGALSIFNKLRDSYKLFQVLLFILTTVSPSELENRVFRLQGERLSLNEPGSLFKTSVEHVDSIVGPAGDVKTELFVLFRKAGAGTTGWDEANQVERSGADAAGSANALWPGHHWRSIKEVHNL
ncbi:hypothetical protein C8R47DRAFT_1219309 [Mycena vitilis]|nr:hypothetical protein C8R47DRAFT_1219309 [Mycena vitilis]